MLITLFKVTSVLWLIVNLALLYGTIHVSCITMLKTNPNQLMLVEASLHFTFNCNVRGTPLHSAKRMPCLITSRCPLLRSQCMTAWWNTHRPFLTNSMTGPFQASAAEQLWPSRFRDVMQRGLVVGYRHFGTAYRSYHQGSSNPSRTVLPLKMEPKNCPKMSVTNY